LGKPFPALVLVKMVCRLTAIRRIPMTVDKSTQTWHYSVAAKIKIGFEHRRINCIADAGRAVPFRCGWRKGSDF
jgi:hypothetical protein